MTFDDVFAVVVLTGVVVASVVAVFFSIPRLLRSLCRYRLWTLRDDIIDDIFDGRLPRTDPGVQRLVEMTEKAIVATTVVTLFKLVVGEVFIFRGHPTTPVATQVTCLSEAECELLKRREQALMNIMLNHTLVGSPSGWLALLVFVVAVVVLSAWVLISRPLTHRTERDAVAEARRPLEKRVRTFPAVADLFATKRSRRKAAYLH